ncbi:IS91 family transposase [Aliivibrio logei]|uniref:IS91 family transposase n=1 Tax=Aliivibrio logei TaxID=688 RepID=UPI0035C90DC5
MGKHTVQTFLQKRFESYSKNHRLPLYQLKGISRLSSCRTSSMGGHALYCDNGHLNGYWYNSCGHRSCPQCGALKREQWLKKVDSFILDTSHHHWVFTLPHELHEIWRYNRALCQQTLFDSIRKTIQILSADERFLGAKVGCVLALHTWARNLTFHPHIHCLVTHGGLGNDGWVEPKKSILFPARVMMKLFRGKFIAALRAAMNKGELNYPESLSKQNVLNLFNKWGVFDWVVHCTKPYSHGAGVVKYLARYVRGGAIKNSQILHVSNKEVRVRYKSHQTKKTEMLRLKPNQFIERILSHIAIPKKQQYHFVGLYHNRCRERLNTARQYLGQERIKDMSPLLWREYAESKGQVPCCDECGGKVTVLARFRVINGEFIFSSKM